MPSVFYIVCPDFNILQDDAELEDHLSALRLRVWYSSFMTESTRNTTRKFALHLINAGGMVEGSINTLMRKLLRIAIEIVPLCLVFAAQDLSHLFSISAERVRGRAFSCKYFKPIFLEKLLQPVVTVPLQPALAIM